MKLHTMLFSPCSRKTKIGYSMEQSPYEANSLSGSQ